MCQGGSCVAKPQCGDGADNPACPDGQECQGGTCRVKLVSCNLGGDPVFFDFDKANLRNDQRVKLDGVAACLKNNNLSAQIGGHADERGTEEYNLALSDKRASTAKAYLVKTGVSNDKLSAVGFGETNPVASGSSEDAWSKNRRVEVDSK
jgi:peptidoglycan-associated lipoprotein